MMCEYVRVVRLMDELVEKGDIFCPIFDIV